MVRDDQVAERLPVTVPAAEDEQSIARKVEHHRAVGAHRGRRAGRPDFDPFGGRIVGQQAVLRVYHAIPTNSEDFAHFLQKTPGVMFWLGGSDEANGVMALPHAPTFAVDERALGVGIKGLSQVLIQRLADAAR